MRRPRLIAGLAGRAATNTPALRQNVRNQPFVGRSRCGQEAQNPANERSLARVSVYAGDRLPPFRGRAISTNVGGREVKS